MLRHAQIHAFQVGNQAFANYVDAQPRSFTRINNKKDPVPVLPPIDLFGYHHASGEIHIRDDDVWVSCPGMSTSRQLGYATC